MGSHSAVSAVSNSGRFAAVIAGVALSSGIGAIATTAEASAGSLLDNIAQCESGGNPTVVNGSGHGGLFQFDTRTWVSVGGTGSPQNASVAEQYKRAAMLLAARGTQPWDASKGCWGGKSVSASNPVPNVVQLAPKPIPIVPKPKPTPFKRTPAVVEPIAPVVSSVVSVVPSTTDRYQVVKGNTLSDIALAHKMTVQDLFNLNRHIIANPDLIFPGQALRIS
jgi:LysM repeat protein